jgi:excisionase family DNA binding protein
VGGGRLDPDKTFYSVRDAARVFGISPETLYRAIAADKFPAVKIMGRTIVPAKAIEMIIDTAVDRYGTVDAAEFIVTKRGSEQR